ncbi:phage/plasmid primase, P4 family [Companilactobacillus pabuli]|uniref:phage/plasmid primase, P4 family n=1 Tax=Companilactobacillus pabuli TaxID=2714036 RepID=UPI0024172B6D|nr:phage/plasmid primase, P4 family [Companilactobacillus pabuli]MDG5112766.1 phage/plasmid primase, P4 family [Companilactobacillus pabuli]
MTEKLVTTYDQIPQELRDLKQWGLFKLKWVPERKRNTKIPFSAIDGDNAKSNDPNTWTTFNHAIEELKLNSKDFDGLSFFFANGYAGIDVDHVESDIMRYRQGDYEDNIVSEFMNVTRSYTEVSQSGTGIHIIFKGEIPGARRRKNNIEMYDEGRFFALTGKNLGSNKTINKADISVLYDKYLADKKVVPIRNASTSLEPNNLSEFEIIKQAIESKSGENFKALMYGGWEKIYGSHSEADLALANYLAFWTGKDFGKMDAIFRQSTLYRHKWDEKRGKTTYGVATLNKAINDTNNVFTNPEHRTVKHYNLEFMKDPKEVKELPKRSWDDTGEADRMIDQFGNLIKYSYINNCWYIFNGSYWEVDQSGKIHQLIDAMTESIGKENIQVPDDADEKEEKAIKKAFDKFVKHSRSNSAKRAVTDEIKHRVPVAPNEFDIDKTLLNVSNGYIDLASGELHDHDISKLFSKEANVEYSDKAGCDEWIKFLDQIFDHNQELIDYVQTAVGYSMTGSIKEQIMFILYGNGRNGKSVFLETISNILGTYAKTIQASSIMVKQNNGGPNSDIARLAGARLVTSSEPNEGLRMDEGLVKQLTGGDKVVARQLYGKEFEFEPEFKLWLATNHKPIIRGTDDGIWRRIRLIPFTVQIPDDQVDKDLKYKLARESIGILNWAVDGALKWQQHGLHTPEIIKGASEGYRKEMDVISQFVSDTCEVGSEYSISASQLYKMYKEWAEDNAQYRMSNTKFGREMVGKFKKVHTRSGWIYQGLKVDSDARFNWIKQNE